MKYSLESVPVSPDVEVLPLAVPEQKLIISGSYSLISGKQAYHVDQHEKMKG